VRALVRDGARTLEDLAQSCRAGSDCGKCHERLLWLIEDEIERTDLGHAGRSGGEDAMPPRGDES
jgi:bacterioferritin-associated ferredoxin